MADHRLQIVLSGKDATQKAFRTVTGRLKGLTKSVFNMRNAMVGAASAAGMGYFIKRTIDATAEIERNAKMAGVAVESYQELSYAANQQQVTQEALTDGLKELSLRTDEFVQTGSGPAREAFERLGYTQDELNSKLGDTPALMQDIISRMEGLDKAAQIRIADEIFGGQGGEQFVNMIRDGSDELDRLRQEAHDLGLVIDSDLVKSSAAAKQEIDRLTTVVSAQFNVAVAELAPDIAKVAEDMTGWIKANKTFLTQDVPGHIENMAGAVNDFVNSREFGLIKEYWELAAGAAVGFKVGGPLGALVGAGAGGYYSAYKDLRDSGMFDKEELTRLQEEQQKLLDLQEDRNRLQKALEPLEPGQAPAQEEGLRHVNREIENQQAAIKRLIDKKQEEIQEREIAIQILERETEAREKASEELTAAMQILNREMSVQEESQPSTITPKVSKPDDLPEPFSIEDLQRAADIYDQTRTPVERLKTEVLELNLLANRGLIDHETYTRALNDAYDNLGDKAEESAEETGKAFNYMEEFSRQTAQNMQNNFSDFFYDSFTGKLDSASDYFESFASSLLRTWADVQAQMLASEIFGEKFMAGESGSMGGIAQDIGKWIGDAFSGSGSSSASAKSYDTGGRLPEDIFGFGASGQTYKMHQNETVVPANKSGGVQVNVYNNTPNSSVEVQESQGGKSIDVIIDETVAGKVKQRGSATNRALRNGHRTSIPLTRR